MATHELESRMENDKVLVLERIFDAPRDVVFRMFKDREHLRHWWGPEGWELTVCNLNFKPGGTWHYCMTNMDEKQTEFYGMESWGKAVYKDIVEPERIEYVDHFSDADGKIDETLPASVITLEFADLGHKTKLINRSEYISGEELERVMDMGMLAGITETWNRLAAYLETIK